MIGYFVQHHPARAELLDRLLPHLPEGATVVSDPEPDAGPNPWRTYQRCLEIAHDAEADTSFMQKLHERMSHAVILQDDATPCRNFAAACEAAISSRPDALLVLWHGGQPREHVLSIDRALDAGDAWVDYWSTRWVPTVALAWPIRLACPVVCWIEEQEYDPRFRADDEKIGNAVRALGERVLTCVPSLVEHDDCAPSVVGKRERCGEDPARIAHRWVGLDVDPVSAIDWARGAP